MSLSVSVVIPTYQRAHLLPRAIDSALAQVRPGDEIIVVDDGSTDATPSVVAAYGERVRYLRTPNGGAGAARNRGIELATRDLVAFLDSDDEWMPGKLELARRWLEARLDVLFVFSEFAVTDDAGRPRRRHLIHWHQDPRSWDEILGPGVAYASVAALPEGVEDFRVHVGSLYEREFVRGYVLTSSFVVRRVAAGDALHFGEDVMALEDLECFGRVSARGPGAFFDVETAWQHGHVGHRVSLGLDSLRRAAGEPARARARMGQQSRLSRDARRRLSARARRARAHVRQRSDRARPHARGAPGARAHAHAAARASDAGAPAGAARARGASRCASVCAGVAELAQGAGRRPVRPSGSRSAAA